MNPFDPMPTIKAILGMTMAQDIAESVLLAQLDDFEPPQCESNCHDIEPDHHFGAAGFLFISPCGHGTGYVCVPFVQWLLSAPRSHCARCGQKCTSAELTFIPIGGAK